MFSTWTIGISLNSKRLIFPSGLEEYNALDFLNLSKVRELRFTNTAAESVCEMLRSGMMMEGADQSSGR